MINLNEEIKAQQARLLNIFIQHAKSAIIIIALNYLVRSYITVESLYLPVTLYLTLFMLLFNLTAAVFLMCFKFEFPKLEYFLVYSFNLFTFFSMLVYSFRYFIELPPDTQLLALYVKSYILVTLQKVPAALPRKSKYSPSRSSPSRSATGSSTASLPAWLPS